MKKYLISYTNLINKFQITSTRSFMIYKNLISSSIKYLNKNNHIKYYKGTYFEGYYFNNVVIEVIFSNNQPKILQYRLNGTNDCYEICKLNTEEMIAMKFLFLISKKYNCSQVIKCINNFSNVQTNNSKIKILKSLLVKGFLDIHKEFIQKNSVKSNNQGYYILLNKSIINWNKEILLNDLKEMSRVFSSNDDYNIESNTGNKSNNKEIKFINQNKVKSKESDSFKTISFDDFNLKFHFEVLLKLFEQNNFLFGKIYDNDRKTFRIIFKDSLLKSYYLNSFPKKYPDRYKEIWSFLDSKIHDNKTFKEFMISMKQIN